MTIINFKIPYKKTILTLLEENPELYRAFRWTIVYGLATQKHIKDYIIKNYEENRVAFFQSYKESDFGSKSHDFSFFTSETHDMIIKTAGILAWAEKNNQYSLVLSMIQKGYKVSWNYVKRTKEINVINFDAELRSSKSKPLTEDEIRMRIAMGYSFVLRETRIVFFMEKT
ncbi:hypothetical protein ACFYKT_18155 [Cytobacillus sp. FJAT-53684]|uniref:Uncharacterized protein n=1 Tax=Cytobacillus mangrovibacter TaxID=3299024 RepID=A0ABW6K249_9BACI